MHVHWVALVNGILAASNGVQNKARVKMGDAFFMKNPFCLSSKKSYMIFPCTGSAGARQCFFCLLLRFTFDFLMI